MKGKGSDVAPQLLHTHCKHKSIIRFIAGHRVLKIVCADGSFLIKAPKVNHITALLSAKVAELSPTCSNRVMANFWCGIQCLAVQMSSLLSALMWKWIRIRRFS